MSEFEFDDLKPCPFCGGEYGATVIFVRGDADATIMCSNCCLIMRRGSAQVLKDQWNKRFTPQPKVIGRRYPAVTREWIGNDNPPPVENIYEAATSGEGVDDE